MAEFYEDDEKHVLVLLTWLGWGVGHALLPLLSHADDDEQRSRGAVFMPEGVSADGTCSFSQTRSGMYTHP